MISGGVKLRSFHAGCAHELILPGGRVMLIDPFLRDSISDQHSMEDITGADYILVTHTHFDHELDLGYFVKKYHSLVFAGALSAQELIRYHGISYDDVIPVLPGQTYTMEDFRLETVAAKHNPMGGRVYDPELDFACKAVGAKGHKACDDWGNLESMDYVITTKNNFRFMTVSGRPLWEEPFETAIRQGVDLVIRQAGLRRGSADLFGEGQVSASELAALFAKYHAPVVVPFHMDVLYRKWGAEKTENYFHEVAEELNRQTDGLSNLLYPMPWKWYQVGVSYMEEPEAINPND